MIVKRGEGPAFRPDQMRPRSGSTAPHAGHRTWPANLVAEATLPLPHSSHASISVFVSVVIDARLRVSASEASSE